MHNCWSHEEQKDTCTCKQTPFPTTLAFRLSANSPFLLFLTANLTRSLMCMPVSLTLGMADDDRQTVWGGGAEGRDDEGGTEGKRVTAGDSRASRVSDALCLSNQVHFFISSYPCQALQLADQQSVAVCFNQAAPPLLQTGPDYWEREQGRDEEARRGGHEEEGERQPGEDVSTSPSRRWKGWSRGHANTKCAKRRARWMQMWSLNNRVNRGRNEKMLAVNEETIKWGSFYSTVATTLPGEWWMIATRQRYLFQQVLLVRFLLKTEKKKLKRFCQ